MGELTIPLVRLSAKMNQLEEGYERVREGKYGCRYRRHGAAGGLGDDSANAVAPYTGTTAIY
ncbi:hypothetical protein ColLi_11461 [Colletotrichum liriopes]|uniref:Uncharacterized protein n=1 Tax=Colletotrichum liriopes TaxID=708192 RepID=A0AA37GWI2_9PEZI|nr:hypothetical protein ColLi_11461 [Colletotrichum liriopes]